jgi:hypothetical protein
MKRLLTVLALGLCVAAGYAQGKAQQVADIRKMYADAKKQIDQNGKNGMAPLDMTIQVNNGTEIDKDFTLDQQSTLTFYFNKYRINSNLDYPDASSCYFITEQWEADGHTRYREFLFDPNEGGLLFAFMKSETHAGFAVETRYYYDGNGKLVDQRHKVNGENVKSGTHTWNDAQSEKDAAHRLIGIFDTMMNPPSKTTAPTAKNTQTTPKADRMKTIRSTYAKAKDMVAKNGKEHEGKDISITVHDQSWGPPMTQQVKFYFDSVNKGDESRNHCYFISEHRHHNRMGPDSYAEYLLAPTSHDLIFSYTKANEEGNTYEWRYYFDENGRCIETKTASDTSDDGRGDKQTVSRYVKLFDAIVDIAL